MNKEKDKTNNWDNKFSSKKELLSIVKEEEKDEEEIETHDSAFNDFLNSTQQQQQQQTLLPPPITNDPLFENSKNINKSNDVVDYSTVEWKIPLYAPCRPGEPVGSVKYIKPEEPKKAQPLNVVITDNNNKLQQLSSLPSLIPMVQIPQNNNNNISPPILPLIPRIDKSQFPSPPSINNNDNVYNNNGVILDPRLNLTNQQPNKCINPQPNKCIIHIFILYI